MVADMQVLTKEYNDYLKKLDFNVSVFEDTLRQCTANGAYSAKTRDLIENGAHYYVDGNKLFDDADAIRNNDMSIEFINSGTCSAAYWFAMLGNVYRVAMLDFADAKRPGGWPDYGAPTQEEDMCRCTNMYLALASKTSAKHYYTPNNPLGVEDHLDEAYTDRMIYLRNVTILKSDVDYNNVDPVDVDVIVSPAPCGKVPGVESIIYNRAKGILKTAYVNGADCLILGAWGCGAFGQNPKVVARCFANALRELPLFKKVVFAFRPTAKPTPDKRSTKKIFEREFRRVYGN